MLTRVKNSVFGGVCAGLSRYFGLEPVVVRLCFVMMALFGDGIGIFIYLILMLCMPEEA